MHLVGENVKPISQFIHESVRDFLLRDGRLAKVWPALGGKFAPVSHDRLKTCCLDYIRIVRVNDSVTWA
ncbi:hypothetical protein MCOR02_008782 [Pyricularia oryzae]|nr:hypothetical protein MCOR02_008782 [Pyricularia oryzae]